MSDVRLSGVKEALTGAEGDMLVAVIGTHMRLSYLMTAVFCSIFLILPAAGQDPIEGDEQELALRQDSWTHLVVTLKNGRKVTFTRGEIGKVQYVTQRATSASSAESWMGHVWRIREAASDGRYCDGVWTRQGTSNRFQGQWTCSWGPRVSDTLVVQPLRGNSVSVYREGIRETYRGTLASDGRSITGPGFSPSGNGWTVKIE
jgi:hypothetical protein